MICHGGGSDGHAASFNGSPPSALYSGLLEEIYLEVYLSITKIKFIKFRKQEESLEVIVHQTHSPAQCWLNIKLKTPAFQWDGMLEEWLEWRNYYLANFIYRSCAVSVLTLAATLDIFVRNDERKIKSEPPTGFSSKNYTTPPSFPYIISSVQTDSVQTNNLPTPNLHSYRGICWSATLVMTDSPKTGFPLQNCISDSSSSSLGRET